MRTGDIGERRAWAPVVKVSLLRQTADPVGPRSRRYAEDSEVRAVERTRLIHADRRSELDDARNVRVGRVVAMLGEVIKLPVHRQTRFEQNDVGQRIRPPHLDQPGGMDLTGPPAVPRRPRRHRAVAWILAGIPLVPE